MSDLQIRYLKIDEIKPYGKNPRKNEKAVAPVAESMSEFGVLNPLVIDKNNVIVCGHTRYLAAKKNGIDELPVVYADDLDEKQVKAFRIVDNKVGEYAIWDIPLMEDRLNDIGDVIDMEKFGFDFGEEKIIEPNDFSGELDEGDFADDKFDYECPECGFRFNE